MKVIKHKDKWYLQSETGYKEILLSTDTELIKDGVQAIDDEFIEWFVNNPSCEFVEVVEDKKLSSKSIYDAVEGDLAYNHHGYGGIINNLSNDVRVGISNYLEVALTSETGWETLDINNYKIYDKCYKIIIPKEEYKTDYTAKHIEYCHDIAMKSLLQEESKQETLEEGAKWQAEKMYSEEEVIRILDKREDYLGTELNIIDYLTNKEWFEQFKKK